MGQMDLSIWQHNLEWQRVPGQGHLLAVLALNGLTHVGRYGPAGVCYSLTKAKTGSAGASDCSWEGGRPGSQPCSSIANVKLISGTLPLVSAAKEVWIKYSLSLHRTLFCSLLRERRWLNTGKSPQVSMRTWEKWPHFHWNCNWSVSNYLPSSQKTEENDPMHLYVSMACKICTTTVHILPVQPMVLRHKVRGCLFFCLLKD